MKNLLAHKSTGKYRKISKNTQIKSNQRDTVKRCPVCPFQSFNVFYISIPFALLFHPILHHVEFLTVTLIISREYTSMYKYGSSNCSQWAAPLTCHMLHHSYRKCTSETCQSQPRNKNSHFSSPNPSLPVSTTVLSIFGLNEPASKSNFRQGVFQGPSVAVQGAEAKKARDIHVTFRVTWTLLHPSLPNVRRDLIISSAQTSGTYMACMRRTVRVFFGSKSRMLVRDQNGKSLAPFES